MKKFLSLVLALVMVMSLVTINAGAADFTDDDDITYVEAADVISAIGVMDGNAGAFNPDGGLTRRAAAKIICNMLLGPTTAANLRADTDPFPDVPASNEFAGYIAYCAKEGIIGGYSDGTFKPANPLSGNAFMKMLLGALGYDSAIEGFAGPNWTIQVAKVALGIGLDDDLTDDFNGSKAVTREEAALYAFNTLKATLVDYDNRGTSWNIGGVEFVQNPGKAKFVEWSYVTSQVATSNEDGQIDGKGGDGFVQFAERHFTKLEKQGADSDFYVPSHQWIWKGDKIATYEDTPTASYVGKVTYSDIYNDAKLTSTTDDFDVYIDGVRARVYDTSLSTAQYKHNSDRNSDFVTIARGDGDSKVGTGKGCLVDVYKDVYDDHDGIIVVRNVYVGQVVGVEKASGKNKASTELAPVTDDYLSTSTKKNVDVLKAEDSFESESFNVDDIVTFNYSFKDDCAIDNVAVAEPVTGKVTSFASGSKITLDGKTYEYGEQAATKVDLADVSTSVKVYLDGNGYAMYYDEGDDNLKNYAFVLDAGSESAIGGSSKKAELLYTDGTTDVVKTDKFYGQTNDPTGFNAQDELVGQWVTYKVNSKGETVLSELTGMDIDSGRDYVNVPPSGSGKAYATTYVTVDSDGVTNKNKNMLTLDTSVEVRINSETLIIVKDEKGDYTVYNGVKEMPTIEQQDDGTGKIGYFVFISGKNAKSTDYAKLVYIEADHDNAPKIKNSSKKTIFLVSDKDADHWGNVDRNYYYEFDAVVDGKIPEGGTVVLDYTDDTTRTAIDKLLAAKDDKGLALDTYSVDNGVYKIDAGDFADGTPTLGDQANQATEVEKVKGTSITFNTGSFTVADDCVFFRVNVHGDLVEASKSNLRTGKIELDEDGKDVGYYTDLWYTLNSDEELTGVYWVVN